MKILIIRVSSLGDVVHTMPLVQDLLRHFPQAEIDWVVEEAYVPLVQLCSGVRRIIPFALRRWRKSLLACRAEIAAFRQAVRSEAYDYVFEAQGLLKTGLIMHSVRTVPGGKKIGLGNASEGSGYEGISRVFHDLSIVLPPRTHAVARSRLLAAHALGLPVQDLPRANFGLRAASQENYAWQPEQEYVVFFHATAGAAKKWPVASWIALGQYVTAQGWPLLLPWGSAAEQQDALQLAAAIPGAKVLPKLGMLEAVELARRARLVVGVDTGLTHIAAAYQRPCIELYCASPRWKTECDWSEQVHNLGDAGQVPELDLVKHSVQTLLAQR